MYTCDNTCVSASLLLVLGVVHAYFLIDEGGKYASLYKMSYKNQKTEKLIPPAIDITSYVMSIGPI